MPRKRGAANPLPAGSRTVCPSRTASYSSGRVQATLPLSGGRAAQPSSAGARLLSEPKAARAMGVVARRGRADPLVGHPASIRERAALALGSRDSACRSTSRVPVTPGGHPIARERVRWATEISAPGSAARSCRRCARGIRQARSHRPQCLASASLRRLSGRAARKSLMTVPASTPRRSQRHRRTDRSAADARDSPPPDVARARVRDPRFGGVRPACSARLGGVTSPQPHYSIG